MKHLILDTETTGLLRNTLVSLDKQPQMFEFYGYRIDPVTFEEYDELHFFSKPTIKMEEGAKKATGKNDNFVANFDPFKTNAQRLKDYIESSDAIIAHNAMYDYNIIDMEFKRLGIEIKWPEIICTIEKTEAGLPNEDGTITWTGYRQSLTKLHEFLFNEKFGGVHQARDDVRALGRCYIELIKRGWL